MGTNQRCSARLDRFEQATELPLLVLALLVVPLLLAPLLLNLSSEAKSTVLVLDWMIWGIFAAELLVRLYLAPQRGQDLYRHWFDVLIVVLPFLRPLRVARSARALRVLRGARGVAYAARATHAGQSVMRRQGVQLSLVIACGAIAVAAVAVTFAERSADGSIDSFGTAVWWAITTITTVGYGDTYPVTALGRGVGVFLMFVGIALFGVVTANVAAFFFESKESDDDETLSEVLRELRRLHARLDAAAEGDVE